MTGRGECDDVDGDRDGDNDGDGDGDDGADGADNVVYDDDGTTTGHR